MIEGRRHHGIQGYQKGMTTASAAAGAPRLPSPPARPVLSIGRAGRRGRQGLKGGQAEWEVVGQRSPRTHQSHPKSMHVKF